MKQMFFYSMIVMVLLASLTACSKLEGGLGGKGEIKGQIYSNISGKVLKGSIVYIKYGADSKPGINASDYNDLQNADSDAKFDFKYLTKGSYYIYATGEENGVALIGGVVVILNEGEIKENLKITLAPL
jgi:hypothetical protein